MEIILLQLKMKKMEDNKSLECQIKTIVAMMFIWKIPAKTATIVLLDLWMNWTLEGRNMLKKWVNARLNNSMVSWRKSMLVLSSTKIKHSIIALILLMWCWPINWLLNNSCLASLERLRISMNLTINNRKRSWNCKEIIINSLAKAFLHRNLLKKN